MKKIFIALAGAFLVTADLPAQIELLAFAVSVRNEIRQEGKIEDGFLVDVIVINNNKHEITLPSRMLGPEIIKRDDRVIFLYAYHEETFHYRGDKYPVIPSKESFAPVVLKPGECMQLAPQYFGFERRDIGEKPVFFALRTRGFLAKRLGFSEMELECKMTYFDRGEEQIKQKKTEPGR
jgi:hypothetical protein